MTKNSRIIQSTLKRRVRVTKHGNLTYVGRFRLNNSSFSYPKKRSKRLFSMDVKTIPDGLKKKFTRLAYK